MRKAGLKIIASDTNMQMGFDDLQESEDRTTLEDF